MIDYKSKSFYFVLVAFGGAIKVFLGLWFGIQIGEDQLDAAINLFACIVVFIAIPANTWFTKRRQTQKQALQQQGLYKVSPSDEQQK